jgi:hypothetical protein
MFIAIALFVAPWTYVYAKKVKPQPKEKKVHVGLTTQFVEILGVGANLHHTTVTMETAVSVAVAISMKWSLVGSASLVTSLDSTSLGGALVLAANYNLYRSGPYRFGIGPDLGFVHIRLRSSSQVWKDMSIILGGAGVNIGLYNVTIMAGVGAGYTPQFEGAWSLAFRLGFSVNI